MCSPTAAASARRKPPCVQWTDPLPPHSVENVGGSVLSILMVELKSTRVVGQPAVPKNAGRRG
jgi:hypothetical protein